MAAAANVSASAMTAIKRWQDLEPFAGCLVAYKTNILVLGRKGPLDETSAYTLPSDDTTFFGCIREHDRLATEDIDLSKSYLATKDIDFVKDHLKYYLKDYMWCVGYPLYKIITTHKNPYHCTFANAPVIHDFLLARAKEELLPEQPYLYMKTATKVEQAAILKAISAGQALFRDYLKEKALEILQAARVSDGG